MRVFSALSSLLLAGVALAQSSSSCSPKSSDVQTVQFAWALQYLTERFWSAQALNQTFLSGAPNASNANYDANFKGITRQNRLGVRAVQQLGSQVSGFSAPRCNFSIPAAQDAKTFTKNALTLEQTVAGALVGLSAYTQAPQVSFLLARLAAQHSAHAAYIGNEQNSTYFPSNSSSLFPAYTPDQVLKTGNQTGQLGTYLKNCVSAPTGPCGQKVSIGPLVASLNSTGAGGGGAGGASGSASPSGSATPSSSVASASPTTSATARHRKYY
ncbi:hypothetical protein BBP40_003490 [Aspergillus hancockii]|nr:hypothetical protein BBP40_003490 [Aspergillus hancockii]